MSPEFLEQFRLLSNFSSLIQQLQITTRKVRSVHETKVRLKSYRAFEDTGSLRVKPLTFLVGENSSGKTSFLAALNFILKLRASSDAPTLNEGPFDLGSFEQIAHKTKDSGQGSTFQFEIETEIPFSPTEDETFNLFDMKDTKKENAEGIVRCILKITFCNKFGDAHLSKIEFSFADIRLAVELSGRLAASIFVDGREIEIFSPKEETTSSIPFSTMGLHLLGLVLNGLYIADKTNKDSPDRVHVSRAFGALNSFLVSLPSETFAGSPIRSTPERVYSASEVADSADGKNTPYKLRRAKIADVHAWRSLRKDLNRFGILTGLFSRIDVARLTKDHAGPFQIKLQVGDRRGTIADVGYGVSQTLPMITSLIQADRASAFLFQQPEVHLHPKAQAGVGTYLATHIKNDPNAVMVVETHSDFILDRVRTEVRKGTIKSSVVTIIYFESVGDKVKCHQIDLDEFGNLIGEPDCYRSFFLREQAANVGIDF